MSGPCLCGDPFCFACFPGHDPRMCPECFAYPCACEDDDGAVPEHRLCEACKGDGREWDEDGGYEVHCAGCDGDGDVFARTPVERVVPDDDDPFPEAA